MELLSPLDLRSSSFFWDSPERKADDSSRGRPNKSSWSRGSFVNNFYDTYSSSFHHRHRFGSDQAEADQSVSFEYAHSIIIPQSLWAFSGTSLAWCCAPCCRSSSHWTPSSFSWPFRRLSTWREGSCSPSGALDRRDCCPSRTKRSSSPLDFSSGTSISCDVSEIVSLAQTFWICEVFSQFWQYRDHR